MSSKYDSVGSLFDSDRSDTGCGPHGIPVPDFGYTPSTPRSENTDGEDEPGIGIVGGPSTSSGASSSTGGPAGSAGIRIPASDAPALALPRREGVKVPGGTLFYYVNPDRSTAIVAVCHNPNHPKIAAGTECSISRKIHPAGSGQAVSSKGRPMASLVARLALDISTDVADPRWEHVHRGKPSRKQRCDARVTGKTNPELLMFFFAERLKRSKAKGDAYDEESEPEGEP